MITYADLHCDTLWRCYEARSTPEAPGLQVKRNPPFNHLQTYAIYIPDGTPDPYRYFRSVYAYAEELMRRYPEMVLCKTASEINAAFAAGKTPYMYSVEGGGFFDADPERARRTVAELKQKGIAFLSLCYNRGNALAGGVASESGLSEAGKLAALLLHEAGITVDISHLNRRSADALLALLPDGIAATHSNCFALAPHPRNLADDQIKALIDRGGLMGINFYPPFLVAEGEACIEDILRHIRHVVALGGARSLAFGSDFDGIDRTPRDLPDLMSMPLLFSALEKEWGQMAEDFLYRNALRFIK